MAYIDFNNAQTVAPGDSIEGVPKGILEPDEFRAMLDFKNPVYDPAEWARKKGLKVTDDGFYCYKAVLGLTLDGATYRYFSGHGLVRVVSYFSYRNGKLLLKPDKPFEYIVGSEAVSEKFDTSPLKECSYGLYGCSMGEALAYYREWIDIVHILTLFVPFENNHILVPYDQFSSCIIPDPSWKIRFQKCQVLSAFHRGSKLMNENAAECDDTSDQYMVVQALKSKELVQDIFDAVDKKKG